MSVENIGNPLALNRLLALEQSTQMKNSETYKVLIEAIGEAGGALALNRLLALEQLTQMKNSETYRTLIRAIGRAGRIS